jgi:polar amino acid transport system substrate-binding protein
MAWTLRNKPDLPKLRSSGNIYAAPIYAAFAPAHPHAQALARVLSDGVRHLRATGELERIYQSYGLGADGKARVGEPFATLQQAVRCNPLLSGVRRGGAGD